MNRRRTLLLVALALVGLGAWLALSVPDESVPAGFARAHGRIEAVRIDVATKFAGRIANMLAQEGDFIDAGALIARMDDTELRARIRSAEAAGKRARMQLMQTKAAADQKRSELRFAGLELQRAEYLEGRGVTAVELADRRRTEHDLARAAVDVAEARIAEAQAAIEEADAVVDQLKTNLEDLVLKAPRPGRVQYRLAEPGEVLPAGGKVATMLDLTDVHMNVFLPTAEAGRLSIGAEARIIFDAAPQYVVPAEVTFVASEAQFTPKYVETASERAKLMFRVKLKLPPDLLREHQEVVKAGVPGVATIRVDADTAWPEALAVRLPE